MSPTASAFKANAELAWGAERWPPGASFVGMYKSLADAVRDAQARGTSLAQLALETESEDQGRPISEIRDVLGRALTVMRGPVEQGMTGDLRSASVLAGVRPAKLLTGPPRPPAHTPCRDI